MSDPDEGFYADVEPSRVTVAEYLRDDVLATIDALRRSVVMAANQLVGNAEDGIPVTACQEDVLTDLAWVEDQVERLAKELPSRETLRLLVGVGGTR